MSNKNIYVFTDFDLDGTASLLVLHWALGLKPGEVTFKSVTVSTFRKEFLKWAEHDSINNYDQVYFLDLDVSTCADLVDNAKSVIIDHHLTHVNAKSVYTKAKVHVVETTSCAKLLYNYFKADLNLNDKQKLFIALANDYDCYKFALPDTYSLNCLYSNTQRTLDKTKAHKFIENYYNGFTGFNQQELNIIKEHITNRDNTIKNLEVFVGTVSLNKQPWKISGTTGSKFVNEVCDYLITKYNSDIVFFVNPGNQHVSFRKKKECPIDLSKLAAKLCEGGGHEYAAGGKITDTFMEFTKQLSPAGA